eukprot:18678-Pleurochrysis_carterae.AAC.1
MTLLTSVGHLLGAAESAATEVPAIDAAEYARVQRELWQAGEAGCKTPCESSWEAAHRSGDVPDTSDILGTSGTLGAESVSGGAGSHSPWLRLLTALHTASVASRDSLRAADSGLLKDGYADSGRREREVKEMSAKQVRAAWQSMPRRKALLRSWAELARAKLEVY